MKFGRYFILICAILGQNNLFSADADLNMRFITAVSNGDIELARQTLDDGADVNFKHIRMSALQLALHADNPIMVRPMINLLLSRGASVSEDRITLIQASRNGFNDLVRMLLDSGSDVNKMYHADGFAIQFARNDETVKLLLQAGANQLDRNMYGRTALGNACRMHNIRSVMMLLIAGADTRVVRKEDSPYSEQDNTKIKLILKNWPKLKHVIDNAIQSGDPESFVYLTEILKKESLNSSEFIMLVNYLVKQINLNGINSNSRKLLIIVATDIALRLYNGWSSQL